MVGIVCISLLKIKSTIIYIKFEFDNKLLPKKK